MYYVRMRGRVFRAVADPTRRRILERLRGGERSVTDLASPFRMSQPAVSQHLRVLRAAGLVRERRQGRRRFYRLYSKPLRDLSRWAAKQIEDPAGHVWRLAGAGVEET